MQNRISTAVKAVQKQLDFIVKYDWDFDHYLEDVPAAVRCRSINIKGFHLRSSVVLSPNNFIYTAASYS